MCVARKERERLGSKRKKIACSLCGGCSHVESLKLLGKKFVVCIYCRTEAFETLESSSLIDRDDEELEVGDSEFGYAVVFDGTKEVYRA